MSRKNLILLHRGPRYEADFKEIAERVHALDPTITVIYLYAGLDAQIPDAEWQFPTLTVALCEIFKLQIKRGPVLRNHPIDKFRQQAILRAGGIASPMASPFHFGMKLDPILFGDFVLLKPLDPRLGSHGQGIRVLRRARAERITLSDFPPDHPIALSRMGYIVQKFVYTGEFANTYRVTTFLGEPIFAFAARSTERSPSLDAPDSEIEAGAFTQKFSSVVTFEEQEEYLTLARDVAAAFDDVPLLGIDFVRDARTGKIFVLEVNAGGNTWHFSSDMWEERRRDDPDLASTMKQQFGAFDVAARALVDRVHRLAA